MTLGDLIKRYIRSKKARYYQRKYFEVIRKREKDAYNIREYIRLMGRAQYYFTKFCQNTCISFAE